MYLKRLEMKGFKSFANRTELVFAPGITAIVGPNGSGKSNVTDAIRWVLGEQSAKSLRGAKMEDVIFAGSSSRKPVGYCEVSITFDNADRKLLLDYAEVTITRRVNRSGESQFFINKQPCRLKDIQELFMDTGIGKEAYSMIGQGRIDEILSAKSEGRRAIFEEAAGIVKYKTRKMEAERKLEQTEENLSRIHDRIDELKTQIGPIKEQAEKAKEWKQYQEELKHVEIALYVDKIQRLHQTWEEMHKEIEENKEKQLTLAAELNAKEAQLETVKLQLQQQDASWEQIQSEMLEITERIKKAEGKENVYIERMNQQQARQDLLKKRFRQLEADQQQLAEQLHRTMQQLEKTEQDYEELKELLAEQHKPTLRQKDQDLKQQLDACEEELQKVESTKLQLSSQKEFFEQQRKQLEEDLHTYEKQKQAIGGEVKQSQTAVETSTQKLAQIEEEQRKLNQRLQELAKQWQQADTESKQLEQQLQSQMKKAEKLQSRYELFKEMQKNREGYFRGVKELLQERERGNDQLSGIYGAVAELIEVPPKYEVAIETALGNAMQYLVVANEQVGQQGIAYLKQRQLGRATFLPLTVIKEKTIPAADLAECKQQSFWVGIASELIQTDPKFRPAVNFLLGNVLVVETIEHANQCARLLRHRYRIVTLDGDMVHAGGSMTGGSRKRTNVNLLSRGKQLEQLKKEWKEAEAAKVKLQDAFEAVLTEKSHWNKEKQQLTHQMERTASQLQELKQKRYQQEFYHQNQQDELKSIEQKCAQLISKQQEMEQTIKEIETSLRIYEQQIEQLTKERNDLYAKYQQQSTLKEQEQKQFTALQVKMARLEQERIHHQQNVDRMKEEQHKLQQQQEEVMAELKLLQQELADQAQKKEDLQEQIENLQLQKEQIQWRRMQVKKEREDTLQQRDTYEEEIREIHQLRKKLEAALHEQEVQTNRLDVELNHLLQVLATKYEVSFERAKELYPPSEEIPVIEKKVRSLKRKLSQLGEVNLGAIDEYERISKRLSFFQHQEGDLQEAKQKLYKIIEQIEQEMSKQFFEAFEQIRSAFQQVFTQMFGGGKADLYLTDQDQLLETGIEIVAQPPGKRPQYLSLLSGGERALTAIALLFAVLKIKPVPFCVLDEVDAALDEVNLTRYTSFMKAFAHETQFMMITHRKQSMMGADALYGVTMEESGVSKVVSVQLETSGQQEIATTRE